jgi:hypothetical protein
MDASACKQQPSIRAFFSAAASEDAEPAVGATAKKRASSGGSEQSRLEKQPRLDVVDPSVDKKRAAIQAAVCERSGELFTRATVADSTYSMRCQYSGASFCMSELLGALQRCSDERVHALYDALCQSQSQNWNKHRVLALTDALLFSQTLADFGVDFGSTFSRFVEQ